MVGAKTETGSSEQFARRKRFDGESSVTSERNPVVRVVCAVVGCTYSLPVEEETLRYLSFGAGIGALVGIVLSGTGSYFDRLLSLDATALGTFVAVVFSVVVSLWYLAAVARKQRGDGMGPTWMVWVFGVGYATLMILMFLVVAAPILR